MFNRKTYLYGMVILGMAASMVFTPAQPAAGAQLPPTSTPPAESTPALQPPVAPVPVSAPAEPEKPAEKALLPTPSSAPARVLQPAHAVRGKAPTFPDPALKHKHSKALPGKLTPDGNPPSRSPQAPKTDGQGGRQPSPGWTSLMSEGFEGVFPGGNWDVFDDDGATNGEYFWDDENYMANSGSWSAWAASGGADGVDPAGYYYPDNADSWMIYGPVSLAGANDAELLFSYWNQSEQNYDNFSWQASTDGSNFYGYQVSGNSGGWVDENFDLTAVPTLGNLSGVAQVWIAFIFTSDSSNVDDGPFVDDILLQSNSQAANADLTFYTPAGWSGPIVPSSVSGTTTTGTLFSYLSTYIDWAVINNGDTITSSFDICLYLDDTQLDCWTDSEGLQSGYYSNVTDYVMSTAPSPGTHTLRLVADPGNQLHETDESNNTWEASFTWAAATQPDLTPYTPASWDFPIVPSDVSGTTTVGSLNSTATYLDWAAINNGTTTTTGFSNCIYLDTTQIHCSRQNGGLQQNYSTTVLDFMYTGTVAAGDHTLKLVVDANHEVTEANENNNTWEHVFTFGSVTYTCQTSSQSAPPDGLGGTVMPDILPRPADVQQRIDDANALSASGLTSTAPGRYDTSTYMTGSIAVGIVMPESAGNMENWSDARMNCVVSKIQTGMAWWKTHGGTKANLSFVFDVHKAVPTQYEPIDHSDSEVGLWIAETMTQMGFSGASYYEQVYDYANYLRSHYNTQWAVVYFVADSLNDPDGIFKNSQYFGWTNLGGPYIIMTYDNDGWGIDNMNWVATHEFGHDFGAGDQYYQAGYGGCTSTTQRYGYLGVANSNCQYNNSNSVPSIMRSNEDALDASAAGQIGWKDSNGNGVYDMVDTQPGFNLTAHTPDPTNEASWSYTGSVYVQPWAHVQCGASDECKDHDVTISTLTSVNFRVDSGGWTGVTAVDGTYNSDFEPVTFTTPVMDAGTHTIEVQATASNGATTSWSDTVTVQTSSCFILTKAANPANAGSVNATPPNCGADRYNPGTVVSLTAAANAPYTFGSWSGDAAGTNSSTTVTMSTNKTVTANFNNPAPTLGSISPSSATAGGVAFTLTANGTNFVNTSKVRWNGADLTTSYVSSTQLTASVPAGSIAAGGTATVTVFNAAPGGGTSGGQTFTINNPAPTLGSINPSSAATGGVTFTLTANGTNFVTTSKVRWNGADLATTYVSSTQLTASVPAGSIAAAGTAAVTVFNGTPGGGTSAGQTFTINNPAPGLGSINPSSAATGGVTFTLTANGTNFVTTSKVRWNGADLATTYGSGTQLTAQVTADLIAAAGSASVTVFTPTPGGGTSSASPFTINNPAPALTATGPTGALAGSGAFSLAVSGTNFVAASKVRWNGADLSTTYVDAGHLTASVPAANLALAGTAAVTVFNPAPGGGTSNPVNFSISNPAPGLGSIAPAAALVNSSAFTLAVSGTNFVSTSKVRWNGADLSTMFVSATQLNASALSGNLLAAGTFPITVFNPAPGGGTSAPQTFTVNNQAPLITSIAPAAISVGENSFTLTVNGSYFVSTSTVRWNGGDLATSYVSAASLRAAVPASLIAAAGTASISVFSPAPGGGETAPVTFNIDAITPAYGSTVLTTRPTLDWEDTPGAASYTLQVSTSPSFGSATVNKTVTASTYTLTSDLARSKWIYWRVRPKGVTPTAWSETFKFFSANPPGVPVLAIPANGSLATTYTPRLDWSTSSVPAGTTFAYYQLQIATDSLFTSGVENLEIDTLYPSEMTLTTPLAVNGKFYWRVCAWNTAGQYSNWSSARYMRTPMLPPVLKSDNLDPAMTTRPAFTWNSVDGAAGYTIQISTVATFSPALVYKSINGAGVTYTPTIDLSRSKTIYWRVRANGANPSPWSGTSSFFSANPPGVPTLAAPVDGTTLAIYTPTLDWNDPVNATYYEVQIATTSTFAAGTVVIDNTSTAPAPSTFAVVTPLAANSTFYWHVRSYDAGDQYSNWSSARHFHTKLPAPGLVSPLNGDPTNTLPAFTWNAVDGATSYVIQVSTSPSFTSPTINKTVMGTTYVSTSKLSPGRKYYWRVYARGAFNSPWSEVWNFTTQ